MGSTPINPLHVDFPFLKGRRKNFQEFFEWSLKYLERHRKEVTISNSRSIFVDGTKCSGWCDGSQIVVAAKCPLVEKVYVHEFAHMTQAVEEAECWKDCDKFWNDLQKQKLSLDSWESTLDIIKLERDCERRAIKLGKKFDLFDTEKYAQEANLYLYYYHYVFIKRKWAYVMPKAYKSNLLKQMPTKLLPNSHFSSINMDIMQAFDKLDKKK